MLQDEQDGKQIAFSEETIMEFWAEERILQRIVGNLESAHRIIVVGSPHSGRKHLITAVRRKFSNSLMIQLNSSYLRQKTIPNEFWNCLISHLKECLPDDIQIEDIGVGFLGFFNVLEKITGKQPLYLIMDDFQFLQLHDTEHEFLRDFERLEQIQNLHFLFSCDVYPSGENMSEIFPFGDPINIIHISEEKNLIQSLKKYIFSNFKGFFLDPDALDAIILSTGKELHLIQRLGQEIFTILNDQNVTKIGTDVVYTAERNLVNRLGDEIFTEQWLSLTFIEQITLMLMGSLSREQRVENFFSPESIEHKITTLIDFPTPDVFPYLSLSQAFELLKLRGILYYQSTIDKYSLTNNLFNRWLKSVSLYVNSKDATLFILMILSKEFAALARNISSPIEGSLYFPRLEKWILEHSLPKESHTKEKLQQDLNVIYFSGSKVSSIQPVLLHISDIQFSSFTKTHAFESTDPKDTNSLGFALINDIKNNYPKENLPFPNIIVISGDIANWGMPEEFDAGVRLIEHLCTELEIDKKKVILAPGNHDVNFFLSKGIENTNEWRNSSIYHFRMAPYERFLYEVYKEELQGLKFKTPNKAEQGCYMVYNLLSEFGLVITSFDSCGRLDHVHSEEAFIWPNDIHSAEEEIQKIKQDIRYKIAIWHHNIYPTPAKNDHLSNWREIQDLLFKNYKYQLGLHGHMHAPENWFRPIEYEPQKQGYVIGAGAVSVQASERAGDGKFGSVPISYNLIQLGLSGLHQKGMVLVREGKKHSNRLVNWNTNYSESKELNLPIFST